MLERRDSRPLPEAENGPVKAFRADDEVCWEMVDCGCGRGGDTLRLEITFCKSVTCFSSADDRALAWLRVCDIGSI